MDRTYLAVRRQLDGMNCRQYDIGIRDTASKGMMSRLWSREEVLKSVAFLKKMNATGADIYVRPAESEGLILVDDVGIGTLGRMDEEGSNPAAVTQTSPQNYQAWVRVSHNPLDTKAATQIAKLLAQRYGGDPNSADWRHYGRLAGFTNQKPIYHRPYVLAERCNGRTAEKAPALLAEALEQAKKAESHLITPSTASTPSQTALKRDIDPSIYATNFYHKLINKYGSRFDPSRADCMVASDLLRMGLDANQTRAILEQTSPDLAQRKEGHINDYLERTVIAAQHRIN